MVVAPAASNTKKVSETRGRGTSLINMDSHLHPVFGRSGTICCDEELHSLLPVCWKFVGQDRAPHRNHVALASVDVLRFIVCARVAGPGCN
ncbi:hypothetical protein BaRGS_00030855 [Batillaria attramentaria]|uniref:Uncharacterized protein n=1 Tax=Batillaria attramentaria TaxID=370345 RepID=A0ABD0JT46_9CAEN